MSNRKNKRRHYGLYALSAGPGGTWFHCRGLRHERGYKAFAQWLIRHLRRRETKAVVLSFDSPGGQVL